MQLNVVVKEPHLLGNQIAVPLPMFGVMLWRSEARCPLCNQSTEPTVLRTAWQLKRQQPIVPVKARLASGRSARQQPDFNQSSSYLYHATHAQCTILSALVAHCTLIVPPQRLSNVLLQPLNVLLHAVTKQMHPFRVIDDETNATFQAFVRFKLVHVAANGTSVFAVTVVAVGHG